MSDMMHSDDRRLDTEEEQDRLSQRLREAREYLGLSQEYVAEQLGIPRASISAIETGRRKVSGVELKQLARLYRCSVASLLGENKEAQIEQPDEESVRALFRAARELSEQDRQQLLRFAEFLRQEGRISRSTGDTTGHV
ncbi:MAG TPA: helix-turn-helix domain-containing protein [Ktedonobacteraceae bacterium]|jgi:transcriptional regulator with XRE-family HTH domain